MNRASTTASGSCLSTSCAISANAAALPVGAPAGNGTWWNGTPCARTIPSERVVVADHGVQPHRQLARSDPAEQVVQAVRLLADQQHRPLRHSRCR